MTSAPGRDGSTEIFPAASHYGWLALGFSIFAIYGSLVPLDFRHLGLGDAIARYMSAWQVPIRVESKSDWLSNILLFIPLGFLGAGWFAVDRPGRSILVATIAIPLASATLSSAIEFIQVYFPSRTVSARDVVAETIGGVIGGTIWLLVGPRLTHLVRARSLGGNSVATLILPGYLLALILSHVMPLDITISPGELYHKYKNGMIRLVPFTHEVSNIAEFARREADEVLAFAVVGLLLGQADRWRARNPWSFFGLGLAIAALIEGLQLLVISRGADSTDIIVGGLAVLAGWMAGRAILEATRRNASDWTRLGFFVVWLGLAVTSSWSPFHFETNTNDWADKASVLLVVPFADYWQGSVWVAADQIFRKAVLFFPIGMLSGRSLWVPLVFAAGLAILLELGQFGLPGRVPSVTDLLVEVGGAWVGHLCCIRRSVLDLQRGTP